MQDDATPEEAPPARMRMPSSEAATILGEECGLRHDDASNLAGRTLRRGLARTFSMSQKGLRTLVHMRARRSGVGMRTWMKMEVEEARCLF